MSTDPDPVSLAIPAPSAAVPLSPSPTFRRLSCVLSQAPRAPGPMRFPGFGDDFVAVLPQQYYEPTLGDDARLDRVLVQWGCPKDSADLVMLDLEYVFGVMGDRPVNDADFADPRSDDVFRVDMIEAVRRVRALRPDARVGLYLPWLTIGLGEARTAAELAAQRNVRLAQQRLNNLLQAVLHECEFIAVSLYRRGETVQGEPMNFEVRDGEAVREIARVRDRSNKACELYVMVSALTGPFQTGMAPIRPEAVTGPIAAAQLHGGFAGAIYWGNAANNQELDWLLRAGDRVAFATAAHPASAAVAITK